MKNMKKQVSKLLDELEFVYNFNEKHQCFEFNTPMANVDVSTILFYDKKSGGLYNRSSLTFNLPKIHTTALLRKINDIENEAETTAHLYLDIENNRIGAQSMIYATENGIYEDVFLKFLASPAQMLDDNYEEIMKVAFGTNTGDNVKTKEE